MATQVLLDFFLFSRKGKQKDIAALGIGLFKVQASVDAAGETDIEGSAGENQ